MNNIIVGECGNYRVGLLNKDGERVGTLLSRSDKINHPNTLSIDKYWDMWVGQIKNIRIYKLKYGRGGGDRRNWEEKAEVGVEDGRRTEKGKD